MGMRGDSRDILYIPPTSQASEAASQRSHDTDSINCQDLLVFLTGAEINILVQYIFLIMNLIVN